MAEQTVELAPGESKEVSFETIPSEARIYQVSVDGLSGSFIAEAPPPPPPPAYCNKAAFDAAYGSKVGDPNYNSIFDFNSDGKIDLHDFVTFGDLCGEYL